MYSGAQSISSSIHVTTPSTILQSLKIFSSDSGANAGPFKMVASNRRCSPVEKVRSIIMSSKGFAESIWMFSGFSLAYTIPFNVNIKFPWKLTLGNDVWLGENAWIDNLDEVIIGNNVCISQGALLLTGNHDYTLSTFDYRNAPIIIEDGAWIGAKTVVCPGVKVESHAILTVGSTATRTMEAYGIYQGNPAQKIRTRNITR